MDSEREPLPVNPLNLAAADEMARIAEEIFAVLGVVAEELASTTPTGAFELSPQEFVEDKILDYARTDRTFAAHCYAARALTLLRSFAVLYEHALPDGALAIARSCREHEAAALVVAFGSADDLDGLIESSFAWRQKHTDAAQPDSGITLGDRPKLKTWMPSHLFKAMRRTATEGHYLSERCEQIQWCHGLLSYLEGHADFTLAVLAQVRSDGVPLVGCSPDPLAAHAAVSATVWSASIAAHSAGASDSRLRDALAKYEFAVPLP